MRASRPEAGAGPLEKHTDSFLALIEEQPDLTLDEIVCAMRKQRIPGSRTSVWRFFKRHDITFKKKPAAAEQERADVARARRRWMREPLDPARLVFIDETAGQYENDVGGWSLRARRALDWPGFLTATGKRSPPWALCAADGARQRHV